MAENITSTSEFEGDDFSNNLFSDLAPLLALFGERVATQYLRHSTQQIENLIFACAPLGILTAVTSAIRIGGSRRLKAIIGRAEEPDAAAEIELVSSTSTDVCELWNGVGIVRVVGKSEILELVIDEGEAENSENGTSSTSSKGYGIYTRKHNMNPMTVKGRSARARDSENNGVQVAKDIAPNISLNTIGRSIGAWELRAVALVGIILQLGVLIFDAVITYHLHWMKGSRVPVARYAYPLTTIGTIGLALGMYLCAYIIDASTKELVWEVTEDDQGDKRKGIQRIVWIQRKQVVGDQGFDSFAIYAPTMRDGSPKPLMTSHRQFGNKNIHRLTIAAAALTVGAFVLQFVGLRAMHFSASIAQLIATAIMTLLRVSIRRHISQTPKSLSQNQPGSHQEQADPSPASRTDPQDENSRDSHSSAMRDENLTSPVDTRPNISQIQRNDPNQALTSPRDPIFTLIAEVPSERIYSIQALPEGFELDMMALQLQKCLHWQILTSRAAIEAQRHPAHASPTPLGNSQTTDTTSNQIRSEPTDRFSLAEDVINTRISLAGMLQSPWETEFSQHAKRLADTIGNITEFLWATSLVDDEGSMIELQPWASNMTKLSWKIPIETQPSQKTDNTPKHEFITMSVDRETVTGHSRKWTPWTVNPSKLEALLHLWMLQLQNSPEKKLTALWLLCPPNDRKAFVLADWWIGPESCIVKNQNLEEICDKFRIWRSNKAGGQDTHTSFVPDSSRIISYVLVNDHQPKDTNAPEELGAEMTTARDHDFLPSSGSKLPRAIIQEYASPLGLPVQYILYTFFCQLANCVSRIIPETRMHENLQQGRILLRNDFLIELAMKAVINGLITMHDAYRMIVCAFHASKILPDPCRLDGNRFLELYEHAIRIQRGSHSVSGGANGPVPMDIGAQKFYNETNEICITEVQHVLNEQGWTEALKMGAKAIHLFSTSMGEDLEATKRLRERLRKILIEAYLLSAPGRAVPGETIPNAAVQRTPSPTNSSLHISDAICAGDTRLVCRLLEQNLIRSGINTPDAHGLRPMDYALERHQKDTILLLFVCGAGIGKNPIENRTTNVAAPTPLWQTIKGMTTMNATEDECIEVTKLLLYLGADPIYRASELTAGEGVLHLAAKMNLRKVVEYLLNDTRAGNFIDWKDQHGLSALHHAVAHADAEIFQMLIDKGAQPGALSSDGKTLLHHAAIHGNTKAMGIPAMSDIDIDSFDAHARTAIYYAAEGGHIDAVDMLIAKCGDLSIKNSVHGKTALHFAAEQGSPDLVRILLAKGADTDVQDHDGKTALHLGVMNMHGPVVYILLAQGVALDKVDTSGKTALDVVRMIAGGVKNDERERSDDLVWLLEKGTDLKTLSGNESALYRAASKGDEDEVMILLRNGAMIAEAKEDAWAPLHISAFNGHDKVVQLLLEKGAEVDQKLKDRCTALYLSAENGHERVVQLLLEKGAGIDEQSNIGYTALYVSAENGHERVVQLLLEKGAGIDEKSNDGYTAIYVSAQNGHERVVQLLLEKGAGIDEKSNTGCTALYVSAYNGHEQVVQLLLGEGAGIDEKSNTGCTALYVSACNGHERVVQLLLEKGAGIDEKSNTGHTALYISAQKGHERIVQLLLEKGAGIDEKSNTGCTALYVSAQNGHERVVQLLLEKGAGIHEKTNTGYTALHGAVQNQKPRTVEVLLAKGASIGAKDNYGKTPRDYVNMPFNKVEVNPEVLEVFRAFEARTNPASASTSTNR